MLGCRPVTRSRNKNVVQLRYVGVCEKCSIRYFRDRRPVKQGTCVKCKSKFDFVRNPDVGKVIERGAKADLLRIFRSRERNE